MCRATRLHGGDSKIHLRLAIEIRVGRPSWGANCELVVRPTTTSGRLFQIGMAQITIREGRLSHDGAFGSYRPSLGGGEAMRCRSCTSENQRSFTSEIAVHFSGLKNLEKPTVFVFPKLLVCMDCGFTEFAIPDTKLRLLGKHPTLHETTRSASVERSVDLAPFAVGLPLTSGEIETIECAADEPLALKNGFYRH
jgi:hypothetical protein